MNDIIIFQTDDKQYYFSDLVSILKKTGINSNDVVFIHSDVGKFGKLGDIGSKKQYNKLFLDACIQVVGNNGTIIMPTFTYSFCKNEIYDVEKSPSSLNYFTELARITPGFIRSEDPIFSVIAKGAKSKEMISNLSTDCFGTDSIFEKLYHENALFLMLGTDLNVLTMIHYIENFMKVPYRYEKIFSGIIRKNGKEIKRSYKYCVRNLDLDPKLSLNKLYENLQSKNKIKEIDLGEGKIMSFRAKDLFLITKEMLEENPYAIVKLEKNSKHDL